METCGVFKSLLNDAHLNESFFTYSSREENILSVKCILRERLDLFEEQDLTEVREQGVFSEPFRVTR